MKKKARRPAEGGGLNITSMMDMMTIILVFLLKSYSTTDVSVTPSKDLQVPVSTARKPPKMAVNVVVSQKEIVVDGKSILDLGSYSDPETGAPTVAVPAEKKRGQSIPELYEVLFDKAESQKQINARLGEEFKGQILLQCDKRLPFEVIREVMYTAGQAQFSEFRFVVIKSGD